VQQIRFSQEVNKALDRISSEIENAISLNNARGSMLASVVSPSVTEDCRGITLEYSLANFTEVVPHGLIPLPGKTKDDIDLLGALTVVDPNSGSIANPDSDAVRILYVPLNSKPLTINQPLYAQTNYDLHLIPIGGYTAADFLSVGDFVIIYDNYSRELLRLTYMGTLPWEVQIQSQSLWNKNNYYRNTFDTGATIQRVEMVTYAHDPVQKILYRDNHMKDDGLNPTTKHFGSVGQRVPNWIPIAKNIKSFHIKYEVGTSSNSSNTSAVQQPMVAEMTSGCPNQVGYPLFRSAIIEITTADNPLDSSVKMSTFSRRATSKNLTRPGGTGNASDEGEPIVISSVVPTSSGGGPVGPTATPGRSF